MAEEIKEEKTQEKPEKKRRPRKERNEDTEPEMERFHYAGSRYREQSFRIHFALPS